MAKSTRDIKKSTKKLRPRGRPRTGIGHGVLVRLDKDLLTRLDGWIAKTENGPTRPEMIRRILDDTLPE